METEIRTSAEPNPQVAVTDRRVRRAGCGISGCQDECLHRIAKRTSENGDQCSCGAELYFLARHNTTFSTNEKRRPEGRRRVDAR